MVLRTDKRAYRHPNHTSELGEFAAERRRVVEAERCGIRHNEIPALRVADGEAGLGQASREHVALVAQVVRVAEEVAVWQPEAHGDRGLERGAVHESQVLLDRNDRLEQFGWRDGPADLPSGGVEGFAPA